MRVYHQKNPEAAKGYYTQSDYFADGSPKLKGQWFGKGASRLGLEGSVDQVAFEKLCDNIDPRTENNRLTCRTRADRRVLADCTLSAPKSVSVLWGLSGDDRILDAVRSSALEAFEFAEQDALTRVNHERGKLTTEKTRNVVGAAWLHTTARPIGDHPDPQLHVHGAILNCTETKDGRWTAVDLSAIVRDSGYYDAIFQSALAMRIQKLGYSVERTKNNFEITGISRDLIEKFSRRTAAIEQLSDELGIRDPEKKDALGATTRQTKSSRGVSPQELPKIWRSRLTAEESDQLDRVARQESVTENGLNDTAKAVNAATNHLFERNAVVRKRDLLKNALLKGIGGATVQAVHDEVAARNWIAEGEEEAELITTREILAEEQKLLAFARQGRGQHEPLAPDHTISREWLSHEQKTAINGLLQSPDCCQILIGAAGTGKTALMREAIDAMEQKAHNVTVLAPTAEAAYGVLQDQEGFDARTLASFLSDPSAPASVREGVIWVDEAGLVGLKDMSRLVEIASQANARVILSGDRKQHKSVAYGEPLRLLEQEAGLNPQEVLTIRRQSQAAFREAVSHLSRGEVDQGFSMLKSLGTVHEISDDDERNRTLAGEYADALQAGESTLIIAPTHVERDQVTGAVRRELKRRSLIGTEDHELRVLKSKRLTEAERSDPLNYRVGDVVEFHRRAKGGWKSGQRAVITEINTETVVAERGSERIAVPLGSAKSFELYEQRDTPFSKGEMIRITKNRSPAQGENTKRLNNGTLLRLDEITKSGKLKLGNGQMIDPAWGHFEHAYALTSHSSQGKTFDRVILAQSAKSYPAASPEQAYVSASRMRHHLSIFTDSADDLQAALSRHSPSKLASELRQESGRATVAKAHDRKATLSQRAHRFVQNQWRRIGEWLTQQNLRAMKVS